MLKQSSILQFVKEERALRTSTVGYHRRCLILAFLDIFLPFCECLGTFSIFVFLFHPFLFYCLKHSEQQRKQNSVPLYLCVEIIFGARFALPLASPKIGCTSAKQNKKMTFCFALRSVCTTFGSAEGTLARKSQNKIWLFPRLFVFGSAEDRLHLGKAKQKNGFLFCIALGLHYLCALLSVIHKYLYRLL